MMVSQSQIEDVLDKIMELGGKSTVPGMTYEEGIDAALRWVMGDGPHPLDD